MLLNRNKFNDQCYACWLGKNIGGTIGTPYEGRREMLDVRGFSTPPGVVLPNDDLDLQLVWLHAVEQLGPRAVTAARLGEFWLSYITPHWNEYGIAKSNMQRGLVAPLAGDFGNVWKHSNGAWIRTEIWACLSPGCPDLAARFAIEDASVDHGTGEGTVAAAFVAAMQSAAFVLRDVRDCIEAGLSRIPEESRVAKSVGRVLDCYERGLKPQDTRNLVQQDNADLGDGWFESPSNVAYAVLGLLYGEGDFKKSLLLAVNCGDDTDCTAATVGATLGIMGGTAAVPEDWRAYIGDAINTISIARGDVARSLPETCTELTRRITRLTPEALIAGGTDTALTDGEEQLPDDLARRLADGAKIRRYLTAMRPYSFTVDFDYAQATVSLDRAPVIAPGDGVGITLHLSNNCSAFDNRPYHLNFRWWLPDGFSVAGQQTAYLPAPSRHTETKIDLSFSLHAGETLRPTNRVVLEITAEGRSVSGYLPIVLLG